MFLSRRLAFMVAPTQTDSLEREKEKGVLLLMNVLLQGPICVKPSDCWEAPTAALFTLRMPAMVPKNLSGRYSSPSALKACVPPPLPW